MDNGTSQRRHLNMHRKLLLDVIKRQAGTLHKALLEGIMNAIEAGASKVDVTFEVSPKPNLRITDDGRGISTLQSIEQFFETFGTPHDESEGKVWAQFRMGRGQLFSFGNNTWRTGTFSMNVDIENNGLAYDLTQNLPQVNGCTIDIDLYKNPIGHGSQYPSVEAFERAIREQIEFMATPVFFNGKRLNKDPKTIKNWTHEDDDAYYLFGVGEGLTIYNIGAYVLKEQTYKVGVTGVIVSKKQLKVNFARNDIQSDCEVYARIKRVINKNRRDKTRNTRRTLNAQERIAMLTDLADGGIRLDDVKNLSLLTTTSGRCIKIDDVRREGIAWSFGPSNDIKADKIMQRGDGIILDKNMLAALEYEGDESQFFSWLLRNCDESTYQTERTLEKWKVIERLYVPFEKLSESLREGYKILSQADLSNKERLLLRMLNDESVRYWGGRVVNIGMSETALAWTNGSSYIALERQFVERCMRYGRSGIAELINTMVHEVAHDSDSSGTHIHGEDFYRNFHDISVNKNPPQAVIADFWARIQKSKVMAATEKQEKREERLNAQRDKALGVDTAIAANSK